MGKPRPGHFRPPGHGEARELAPREHQLALLIGEGLTNDEVAYEMGLTVRTVRQMATGVYHQLGLHTRGNPRVRLSLLLHGGE